MTPHEPRGELWPAIAWAEVLLIVGLGGVVFAVAISLESCDFMLGCGPGEDSLGAASIVWLVVAGAAVATGFYMAALTSGWPWSRAVVQVVAALLAGAAALWLGVIASAALVGEFLPALVPAVGTAGTVSIRPASSGAVVARLVVVAALTATSLVLANAVEAVIGLVLVTLPAIGIADRLRGPTEREHGAG